MKCIFVVVLAFAVLPTVTFAQSCIELMQQCRASVKIVNAPEPVPLSMAEAHSSGSCFGYIGGFVDAISVVGSTLFCAPTDSTVGQDALIYLAWTDKHPDQLHKRAGGCLAFALAEAFPC